MVTTTVNTAGRTRVMTKQVGTVVYNSTVVK
jgi:hypothetical protein